MCCYESIVNQIIQKIIKEMHQTAAPAEREWARENILDAVIEEAEKVVTLQREFDEQKRARKKLRLDFDEFNLSYDHHFIGSLSLGCDTGFLGR